MFIKFIKCLIKQNDVKVLFPFLDMETVHFKFADFDSFEQRIISTSE